MNNIIYKSVVPVIGKSNLNSQACPFLEMNDAVIAESTLMHRRRMVFAASLVAVGMIGSVESVNAAVVSPCSGVRFAPSVVTDIVGATILPITSTLDSALFPSLGSLGLNSNLTTTLAGIAAGDPINLNVLDEDGNLVSPADQCDTTADSYTLDTPKGISIGGNQITGLGNGVAADAGEINSIAFGNGAATNAAATNSIAIGPNAFIGALGSDSMALGSSASANVANSVALGAGSTAMIGAETNYTAYGLTATQTSVGEVSIGSAGNTRKITNLAAGSDATDAVNVSQLQAVDDGAVKYDPLSLKTTVTLGGPLSDDGGLTNGTLITNLHQGVLSSTSTDAVNGAQLYATNQAISYISSGGGGIKYFHANSTSADSIALGQESVAIGPRSMAGGVGSIAMGDNSQATNTGAIAIGQNSLSSGVNSIAIGTGAIATGSVAVGVNAQAGNGGAAFGDNAIALTPQQGTAVGNAATVTANRGVAIGAGAQATRAGMRGATEKYSNVSVTSTEGAVSVGSAGSERQITNLAGGTADTDAVNVRQLDAAVTQSSIETNNRINALQSDISSVRYDSNAGTASAMAMASLPQSVIPGKVMVAAGLASYQGQSAMSIGVSNFSDNGRWVVKFNGSANTRGNAGAAVGVGFHW